MEAKQFPMPAQQGIRLNNMKRLFPEFRHVSKKNKIETIEIGKLWSLDLPIQNDQLLA
jgi:hypothetical protein